MGVGSNPPTPFADMPFASQALSTPHADTVVRRLYDSPGAGHADPPLTCR